MSNFRLPLTEADRAAHNAGRAAYHAGQPWHTYPPKSHERAGWAAASTEEADEATRPLSTSRPLGTRGSAPALPPSPEN